MSKHFSIMEFLRRVRPALLKEYFLRQGLLGEFDWEASKRPDAEAVFAALNAEGDEVSANTVADFRRIWDLQGAGFNRGILNEASFHGNEQAYAQLKSFNNLEKAFWSAYAQPLWAANAKVLSDVDKLPPGAWIKRNGLPLRGVTMDEAIVANLEDELIDFFTRMEHRGRYCKVECLRRGEEEVFFTYIEDHPDVRDIWHEGELLPQQLNDSFKLIFKHNDKKRALDIYLEGNREFVPLLQQIFARSVIGDEIARHAPEDEVIYDLSVLMQPGFQFQHSPDLGILDVRVTKRRFLLTGDPWRRFMAEADISDEEDALNDFLKELSTELPKSRLMLDQVCINVRFHKREEDRRARSRTFYITYPNSLRLKKDELGEKIEAMLVQSGIERRTAGDDE